jgi:hypothetical protein
VGMRGGLVGSHLGVGRIAGHREILRVELCCRPRRTCADGTLWRGHPLRLAEEGTAIPAGRAAVDNHHCGHDMTCLSDRSPR